MLRTNGEQLLFVTTCPFVVSVWFDKLTTFGITRSP
jgi:hypothetical protein